jgi:Transposase DDE domain group 1
MYQSTCPDAPIVYRLDPDPTAEGEPLGSSAHGGLPSFLAFVDQLDVWRSLKECLRLPVQERRTGFTQLQKSQVLVAALAAGCRRSRDNDFTLTPDPLAAAALGLPRWPHSSQLTRHLRAFRSQHVGALRRAVTAITAQHSTVRRRLRRGERVVIDIDQTAISANGRTYQRTARGHLKHKGDRGYQTTAAFAGDTSGGEDEVLALFLDPGNTHASHRFVDVLAALEDLLGPLAHLPGLVLRFDAQYATATDLALLLRRGIRFVGRNYASTSATTWARELGADAAWHELNLVKWVCDLGVGRSRPHDRMSSAGGSWCGRPAPANVPATPRSSPTSPPMTCRPGRWSPSTKPARQSKAGSAKRPTRCNSKASGPVPSLGWKPSSCMRH